MDARAVLVCAFLCVCIGRIFGQVGSLCRPNERLLSCGCPKTCREPVPNCKGVCKEGCFCDEGEVRNDKGFCVKLSDCPPMPSSYKLETSEPRLHGGSCPEDEEYRFCEPCNRSCDNLNPICPAQCAKGCFCKGDLLRDKDGRCVKYEKCSNVIEYIKEREKAAFAPIPYRYSCGHNQQYVECQKCTQSCSDPAPVCGKCRTGCFCKEGFVKGPDGKCVKREECPKGATLLVANFHMSIEECSSTSTFRVACPAGCTRGWPIVPPKCSDPNEVYTCLFGCEQRCSDAAANRCQVRRHPLRCALGCFCRRGLYREGGRCVTKDECFNN